MPNNNSPTDAWEARLQVAQLIASLRRLSFALSQQETVPGSLLGDLRALGEHLERIGGSFPIKTLQQLMVSAEDRPSSQS